MNIKGQDHLLTVQGHSDSTFSNFFSLETAGPTEGNIGLFGISGLSKVENLFYITSALKNHYLFGINNPC